MENENTYEDNVKLWKKAYTDILKTVEKYPDFDTKYSFYDVRDMQRSAKDHLMLIEWYEKYGLKISHDYKPYSNNYFRVSDYLTFSYYKDAKKEKDSGRGGRYISWPDYDKQPKNEWILEISFPTGAYIFGDDYDYQQQVFQDFFEELQSYEPDYSDSHNNNLYWKLENAKAVYEDFNGVLNKYRERNQTEFKQRKADKLRKELEKLEAE